MVEELNQKITTLIYTTEEHIKERADFYARAGLSNLSAIGARAETLLVNWLEVKAKRVEERAEKIFWNMNRPIMWLERVVDTMDSKIQESKQTRCPISEEKKLQELEVSRMLGEGGHLESPALESDEPLEMYKPGESAAFH